MWPRDDKTAPASAPALARARHREFEAGVEIRAAGACSPPGSMRSTRRDDGRFEADHRRLRIGVSARLAKTALAALGNRDPERSRGGLARRHRLPISTSSPGSRENPRAPESRDPAPFRPPMLSHPLEEGDVSLVDPSSFIAEWKWDGIRVQAAAGRDSDGRKVARIYSRTGEDISRAFPISSPPSTSKRRSTANCW